LIEKARHGNREAFEELVLMHFQGVVNVVYRFSGDLLLAEDTAQETFIRAWSKLHTYRPVGSFRGWLYRIATNAALDVLRRRRDELSIDELTLPARGNDVEQTIIHQQQAQMVQQAVLELPAASRTVLVLREYEGFSYQEIADSLEIPLGTVMSRLAYAREALKKKLFRQMEEV
jgi:RNA polymerase sigma-70 factor (ECF subfamily)